MGCMTPYERGYAAALKAAAKECEGIGRESKSEHGRMFDQGHEWAAELCENRILSLPIVGEADQRGAAAIPVAQQEEGRASLGVRAGKAAQSVPHHNPGEQVPDSARIGGTEVVLLPVDPARPGPSQECVMVPREPKKGLLCGDVAISTDPRYAGWVFVRHVDGINWTTGAKLTPETWAMLAATKEES